MLHPDDDNDSDDDNDDNQPIALLLFNPEEKVIETKDQKSIKDRPSRLAHGRCRGRRNREYEIL